jgi:hypothetical protein
MIFLIDKIRLTVTELVMEVNLETPEIQTTTLTANYTEYIHLHIKKAIIEEF